MKYIVKKHPPKALLDYLKTPKAKRGADKI